MISRRTVFVLGAGASYPYGFPTGEELVNAIVALPRIATSLKLLMMEGDSADDVSRFVQDLADSDDPSVDSFLEYRPNYLRIGKLAIAMCLVNKELDRTLSPKYRKQSNNPRGHLAWYHYLWRDGGA
jgi:hypothetical protein